MTESSLLRQIVEANKSYAAGHPRLLDPEGEPFVVVACIDPRLTGLLEPALGLPRRRAVVIRTAGNQLSEKNSDSLRSLAAALYIKNAGEIVIVGHTDCGLSHFSVPEVVENFRRAGVRRTAFGHEDLRAWFGAFAVGCGLVIFELVEYAMIGSDPQQLVWGSIGGLIAVCCIAPSVQRYSGVWWGRIT